MRTNLKTFPLKEVSDGCYKKTVEILKWKSDFEAELRTEMKALEPYLMTCCDEHSTNARYEHIKEVLGEWVVVVNHSTNARYEHIKEVLGE